MKIVRELTKNYKATYLLKKRYYNITSIVGLIPVATGLAIMMGLVFYMAQLLGLIRTQKYHVVVSRTLASLL